MPDSTDAGDFFRGARNPSAGWTPLSAADFAADLTRTHPHYAVTALLDFGGMGAVYAADVTDDRKGLPCSVAIKMLRPESLSSPAYIDRFEREIRGLQSMDHPNVVRILDVGITQAGKRFFVMERLQGRTLASILEKPGRITIQSAQRIMEGVCAGVQHAHDKGLIHRDIKASNVFIVEDPGNGERAVVLDFGVARDLTATATGLSGSGIVLGTEGHIAPELKTGGKATRVSDVYSLGVVFCQMLTGKIPDGVPSLHESFKIDRELASVAERAIRQEPDARYPSAAAFAKAIKDAIERPSRQTEWQSPTPPPPPGPGTGMHERKKKDSSATSGTAEASEAVAPRELTTTLSSDRLQLHLGYLGLWRPREAKTKHLRSTAINEREHWKVVDQWDAIPEIPPTEKIDWRVRQRRKLNTAAKVVSFGVPCLTIVAFFLLISMVPLIEGRWAFALGLFVVLLIAGAIAGAIAGGIAMFLSPLDYAVGWMFDRVVSLGDMHTRTWDFDNHLAIDTFWARYENHEGLLAPSRVFWHPSGQLYTSRDHVNLTCWSWRNDSGRPMHGVQGGSQTIFSSGWMKNAWATDRSLLVQSESFWWWQVGRYTDHWIVYEMGKPVTTVTGRYPGEPFGNLRCNPFRPNDHYRVEILAFPSNDVVCLCDANKFDKEIYSWNRSIVLKAANTVISLEELQISRDESVGSFAWHPSGLYLAVGISGRVDLIHWESAEIVRRPETPGGEKYEIAGWSLDGSLLALDRECAKVWDMRTWVIRNTESHERWTIRDEGSLDNKLVSCDGLRRVERNGHTSFGNFGDQLDGIADVAWSPDDPDLFATVGGKDCPRDIRIWQRVQ